MLKTSAGARIILFSWDALFSVLAKDRHSASGIIALRTADTGPVRFFAIRAFPFGVLRGKMLESGLSIFPRLERDMKDLPLSACSSGHPMARI